MPGRRVSLIEQYNNKDVLTQIYLLKQGLIDEEAARIAADEELGRRIDAEEAARIAADLVLQANIDAEEAARIAADIVLSDRIDAEEAARIAADNALSDRIDAEEAARIAADNQLQANIDAEEAARIAADNQLQANIDAEEAARIAGDADLNTRLNQEEAARLAADYALGERITNEENARIAADNQLLTRIATEESNREAADNALGARIDAEEAARIAADDDIIMELTTQQGKLDTEIADRIAGDAALSDRIDAEEAARIAADNGKLDIAPAGTRAGRVVQTKEGGGYEWVKRTETGVYLKDADPIPSMVNWTVGDRAIGRLSLSGYSPTDGNTYEIIGVGEFALYHRNDLNNCACVADLAVESIRRNGTGGVATAWSARIVEFNEIHNGGTALVAYSVRVVFADGTFLSVAIDPSQGGYSWIQGCVIRSNM